MENEDKLTDSEIAQIRRQLSAGNAAAHVAWKADGLEADPAIVKARLNHHPTTKISVGGRG